MKGAGAPFSVAPGGRVKGGPEIVDVGLGMRELYHVVMTLKQIPLFTLSPSPAGRKWIMRSWTGWPSH